MFVTFHTREWLYHVDYPVESALLCLTVSTGAAAILFLFSVYYVLPNRKVPWRPVLRTSIITGIIWLLARFLFALAIPHVDLSMSTARSTFPWAVFWAYISGLILFAGAQFSVARWEKTRQ